MSSGYDTSVGEGGGAPVGWAEAAARHSPGSHRLAQAHRPRRADERRRRSDREADPPDPVGAPGTRHRRHHLAPDRDDRTVRSPPRTRKREDRGIRRS